MPLKTNFDRGALINPLQSAQTALTDIQQYATDEAKLALAKEEAAKNEAYRREVLGIQQAQEQRTADEAARVSTERDIKDRVLSEYMKAPTTGGTHTMDQFMATPEYKKYVDEISLTPEEMANKEFYLEEIAAKMKAQEDMSKAYTDEFDKSGGQAMLESERYKLALDKVAKDTGKPIPANAYETWLGIQKSEDAARKD